MIRRAVSAVLGCAIAVAAVAGAGCDQGHQDDVAVKGPPVRVVGTNFANGKTVPANGSVQIAFDRLLHPATVNRQAFVVVEPGGRPVANPIVTYDPVARVVSLSAPTSTDARWLTPGLPYEIVLTDADDPDSLGGVRAIDGAAIDRTRPRRLAFFVAAEETAPRARGFEPAVDYCREVCPILVQRCSDRGCHGAPKDGSRPAMGMILETGSGLLNTAIGRVSQEANVGTRARSGTQPARVFGVDMSIIDRGNPGASWLMYKLLMAPPPQPYGSPDAPLDRPADASGIGAWLTPFAELAPEERARLSDEIMGSPMPFPKTLGADDRSNNLTYDELQHIRAWIAQGAEVRDCGGSCP